MIAIPFLKIRIKGLVFQEIRLFRLKQSFTPQIVLDGITRSIQETKRDIVRITRPLNHKDRNRILKKLMCEVVDEEIDRAIKLRSNRCLRCIHGRFYDHCENPYSILPSNDELAQAFGCDRVRPTRRRRCRRFVEISITNSFEDYLEEMNILYELREMINRVNEIFKEYFLV